MQKLEDLEFQIRPGQHSKAISNRKKGKKEETLQLWRKLVFTKPTC